MIAAIIVHYCDVKQKFDIGWGWVKKFLVKRWVLDGLEFPAIRDRYSPSSNRQKVYVLLSVKTILDSPFGGTKT